MISLVKQNPYIFATQLGITETVLNAIIRERSACKAMNAVSETEAAMSTVLLKSETSEIMVYQGLSVVNSEDISGLIAHDMKIECLICADLKNLKDLRVLCGQCATRMCISCIENIYKPPTGGGIIPKRCVSCPFCNSTVSCMVGKNKSLQIVKQINKLGWFEKVMNGTIAMCSTEKCESLIEVEKVACGNGNVDHKCEACIESIRKALEKEKTLHDITRYPPDEQGFIHIDNSLYRQCAWWKCRALYTRTEGCAHMKCAACFTHQCWCCGEGFDNSSDVYTHLDEVWGTYFPKDEDIRRRS
jgi:hypothetical protein